MKGKVAEELLNTGMDYTPYGIALDLSNDKIYFTNTGSSSSIARANLDGSDTEVLVSGLNNVYRIALQLSEPSQAPIRSARWPLAVVLLCVAAVTLSLRRYRRAT